MTASLLALASAALYGTADFLGGLASRRASAIAIVLVSQAAGVPLLLPLLIVLPAAPSQHDFIWGAVAGLAGGVGVALLYRALAIGMMSIVAPTTAVCAVMLPVLVEALRGERLPMVTQGGIALAIVAIVLVSQNDPAKGSALDSLAEPSAGGLYLLVRFARLGPLFGVQPVQGSHNEADSGPIALEHGRARRRRLPPGLALAFVSGVAIGLFFLALARTDAASGVWPLLPARGLSVAVFGIVMAAGSQPLRLERSVLSTAVACGVVDMLANALYLLASRGGPLSVVVTLASLYPASTVILARVVVGERLSRRQGLGIACALVAVVVIVGGARP